MLLLARPVLLGEPVKQILWGRTAVTHHTGTSGRQRCEFTLSENAVQLSSSGSLPQLDKVPVHPQHFQNVYWSPGAALQQTERFKTTEIDGLTILEA